MFVFEGATDDAHETTLTTSCSKQIEQYHYSNVSGTLRSCRMFNNTDYIYIEELNILDGVTATASELNALDGITSSVSELNILDGVTATIN
ncbi:MAG: hypothetical protein CM15mV18_1310 [uncultured marine virus]|nr:MAG: hypothetical protein CM15mV18_1310 [uncultured marine virus]